MLLDRFLPYVCRARLTLERFAAVVDNTMRAMNSAVALNATLRDMEQEEWVVEARATPLSRARRAEEWADCTQAFVAL